MPNYSQAKIYHIVCNITGETYYGSTVQKISVRMGTHRRPDNVCCSKPIIERGDYHYGLVEDYKCENSEQLRMRERYYVDNNDCVNKKSPITSKDEKLAQQKVYRDNSKDKLKAYREANKDKIKKRMNSYCKVNKTKRNEQSKAYNENNKEKEKEKREKKVVCECGCEVNQSSITKHRKTKKHENLIQSLASGGNII